MNAPQKPETASQLINRFLEWVGKQGGKSILYRGLANFDWEVSSSLYRRLLNNKHIKSQTAAEIDAIFKRANEEIITRAEHQSHHHKDGVRLNALQTLAELQHYGAATGLIDFTRNPLVALWFACQSEKDKDKETNGRVVAIDSSDDNEYQIIKSEGADKNPDELFKGEFIWKWQPPPKQNNRIIAQHSEFILGRPIITISENKKFFIPSDIKEKIIVELEKHDISEEYLFCDFYGFTQINAHDRPYNYIPKPNYDANAKKAAQSGDHKKAIELYNRAIEENKTDPILYNERGLSKGKSDDKDGAIIDFDKAIELDSEYANAYFNRGIAKGISDNYQGALKDFSKSLKSNPEDANAYFNRGIAKDELGDIHGALEDYNKAIELNPKYAEAYNNFGVVKGKLGDLKDAIKYLDKAIELNPEHAEAYNNRGVAKDELGDVHGALEDYDKAIKLNPKYAEAYNNLGIVKGKLGDLKDAIKYLDKSIELNSEYATAYYNRGLAKYKLGDIHGALEDYDKAIELNPKHANAYYNRGGIKYELDDKKGALTDFKKANELDPMLEIPAELFPSDDSDSK